MARLYENVGQSWKYLENIWNFFMIYHEYGCIKKSLKLIKISFVFINMTIAMYSD